MARFDYGRMANTATRLLDRFQQGVVTLTRPGVPGPPPNDWTPGEPGEDVVIPLKAAIAAVTVDQANAKYIDGTTITAADLVVTCAAPGIVPSMTDILEIDGQVRTIKRVVQVPAAGVPIVFKLFVQG